MYKIFIDSTQRSLKKVILLRLRSAQKKDVLKKTLIKNDFVKVDEINGEIDVPLAIYTLLKKHGVGLDKVIFDANPGPGSFTGIKMGITAANVFNWALSKDKVKLIKPKYGQEPNITPSK
jgi:tRNA A37 threonylcarbamoyladenosine modification protein TsaB